MNVTLSLAAIGLLRVAAEQKKGPEHLVPLTVNSDLADDLSRIPTDPTSDYGELIQRAGVSEGAGSRLHQGRERGHQKAGRLRRQRAFHRRRCGTCGMGE